MSAPIEQTWVQKKSTTHQKEYWFNTATGETSWERPAVSQATGPPDSNQPPPKRLRLENDSIGATAVVASSYKPPVSGSAEDAILIRARDLPPPRIVTDLPFTTQSMWERDDIMVNDYLAATYKSGSILDSKGVTQKFKDITNPIQGRHLYNLVTENKLTRTLEVGLAMGASAVWITQAHRDVGLGGSHYAIDPNQTKQYENMGELLVRRCGLSEHLTVIERTSYRALPLLLEQVIAGTIPRFHMIYIDGWHTFDYTLVDFFYADLLLEVNGVIVLDDIKHKPVKKCLQYIQTNYPHYDVVPRTPCYRPDEPSISSQATFIKRSCDERVWNHHSEF